ncbi:class II aldolase/adducin family protein [Bradyrhizobium sp. HKCCYLS2038]|uniref:class II aldolase/adducin family protein n=1 Tax=unclassified Bradyrhizobium TaxID=2631580 RepID=UPI003EB8E8B0
MREPGELHALRAMSARVGRNMLLVQGAGGNSSLKDDDVLWVKASGTWLSDADDKDIFVPVLLPAAREALARDDERIPLAAPGPLRASIETSLHALLPHRIVLHVHAVNTIVWAARRDARDEFAARLAGLSWRYVDYVHPGLPLARAVSAIVAREHVDVLILGNHGLVVGADSSEAAEALVHDVETRLALPVRATPAGDETALRRLCAGTDYRLPHDASCHGLATDPFSRAVATGGSLYPDHVVFLGPGLPTVEGSEALATMLARAEASGLPAPVAALAPGLGAIIRNDATPGAEAMLSCLALVTSRLPLSADITYLSSQHEQMLLNWDAERYRQQLTASRQ